MTSLEPVRLDRRVKLRIEDYFLLDEAGAFQDLGATELIDGEILLMSPHHRPHARMQMAVFLDLRDSLRAGRPDLTALFEATVAMPPHDAPQPDVFVTSEPDGEGPVPLSSVKLVVEVADATLRHDLVRKAERYARHGVPEYWVVDVNARVVHQLWRPEDGRYRDRRELACDGPIGSMTMPGIAIGPLPH